MRRLVLALAASLLCSPAFAQTGSLSGGSVTATGATASVSLANRAARQYSATDFTAIAGDGTTDDTAGLNAALTAVSNNGGGTLLLVPSQQYLISSANLSVPANTTLTCPTTISRNTVSVTNPRTLPCALLLGSSQSVVLGVGSGLHNLAIINNAISNPANVQAALTMVAGFAGTAVSATSAMVDLDHVYIVGFATCFSGSHDARASLDYLYLDCTQGIAQDNVHDIARMSNIHVFPFLTGSQSYEQTSYTIAGAADNGAGLIRITLASAASPALVTGNSVNITGVGGYAGANGKWTVTVIDTTHFDLQNSHSTPPTLTGTTASGYALVRTVSSTADLQVGQNITGTGVPGSTTVSAVTKFSGGNLLVLSNAATAANTGVTLTVTNPVYTSGGTATLDADYRPGDGLTVTNSENLSCVSCFVYDHGTAFHVSTGSSWFHCINCDVDGLGTSRDPTSIGFLVDGTSKDTEWLGGSTNAIYNSLVVNSSGGGVTTAQNIALNGYTNALAMTLLQGAAEMTNITESTAGEFNLDDSSGVVHVANSNWTTNGCYVSSTNQSGFKLQNVVSGCTSGSSTGTATFGMNQGPNDSLLIAGYGGGDSAQGAQIHLQNTAPGATNPSKWLRATNTGSLEFMSNSFARAGRFLDNGEFNSTGPYFQTAEAPTLSCGTSPAVDSNASRTGGTLTVGTGSPGTCTITWATAFTSFQHCTLQSESGQALTYSYTSSAITITSPTSASKIDWKCDGA